MCNRHCRRDGQCFATMMAGSSFGNISVSVSNPNPSECLAGNASDDSTETSACMTGWRSQAPVPARRVSRFLML